ncbi:hypothetical protein IFM89_039518 [Coptis chinensis]|uniref:Uncharacterized protein n=1 Tax=Coptis chinensis TaxID=261450 RepID=A0A835GV04_9MAGN|nr:hypothetical protein IFM89_039518 [Coptis chinensis]
MEALNAASFTPVSVLSERRTEPRKLPSLASTSQLKFTKSTTFNATPKKFSEVVQRRINGGLVFLSSVISAGLAKALTYEEVLQQSVSSSSTESSSNIDVGGVVDSVISFGKENPAVIIGGVTILAVPLVLSQIFKKPWGVESAKKAYEKIGEDADAQLLDIRSSVDFKEVGSPDIRGLKKKAVSVVYKGEDTPGFLKKLSLKFKEPENTTLFILDKFDGNSELVAELVTANGFKAAYAIKDGAEGKRGWMEGSAALPVALGLVAASGLSLLAFTEVETILQLVGSAVLIQLVGKKFLYAEDRKATLQQLDEFLTTKVAPKELVGEIKQIGKALLSPTVEKTAEGLIGDPPSTTVLKSEELKTEPEVKAAAEPPQINSVPKTEVKAAHSGTLSPYPYVTPALQ